MAREFNQHPLLGLLGGKGVPELISRKKYHEGQGGAGGCVAKGLNEGSWSDLGVVAKVFLIFFILKAAIPKSYLSLYLLIMCQLLRVNINPTA